MRNSQRRVLAALAPLLFVAAACGGSSARTITLTASSSASEQVEVDYELDGTMVSELVDTPWSQAVEVSGDFDLSFVVTNPDDAGDVGCAIDGLGIGPPLAAMGEAAASCEASGSISSSSSNIVSSTQGTPRSGTGVNGDDTTAEADAGTDAEVDALDEASGIAAELVVVDASAVPTELTQFETFGASLRVTGLDVSAGDTVIVDAALEYRSPTVTSDVNASELYFADDDVVDGTLGHRLTDRSFMVVTDPGLHTLTATGTISVPEQDLEVPFEVALEVDVEPVEVVSISTEFLEGAVTLDVPNSYQVNEPSGWSSTSEQELGIERPLDTDIVDTLIEISRADGAASVLVLRSTRPLSHPDLAAAAQELNESLPLAGTITSAMIGGVESQRIEITDEVSAARIDVFRLGSEVFVVQAAGPVGDPSSIAEAAAIADSIVFDLDAIPRLTHSIRSTVSDDAGVELGAYVAPADWMLDGATGLASSDGLVGARLGFASGDATVESVVASITDEIGYRSPATPVVLAGSEFFELAVDDSSGIRRDFIGPVQGKVVVFTAYDLSSEPDSLLVQALVDSVEIFTE